jgi:hypothetical protein
VILDPDALTSSIEVAEQTKARSRAPRLTRASVPSAASSSSMVCGAMALRAWGRSNRDDHQSLFQF